MDVDLGAFARHNQFALRVRGHSMIEAGILDGDIAIIRPEQDITDGQIVVPSPTPVQSGRLN